jgi:DNA-binding CsgD family transcriptional regulator
VNQKERGLIATVLVSIILMVSVDLVTDSGEGVKWWHLFIEGFIALAAMIGIYFLLRGSFTLKHSLADERKSTLQLREEAEKWRDQSKKYIQGLSQAIETQLIQWNLTDSEKEVAFLLLKGMSLKEIAEVRNTAEKTARTQSVAIYSKAGLAGRSELAAFFLEDLLPPQNQG